MKLMHQWCVDAASMDCPTDDDLVSNAIAAVMHDHEEHG